MTAGAPTPWTQDRLRRAAEKFSTPRYLYDVDEVTRRVARVRAAFGPDVGLLYAVKANPLPALLDRLARVVDGADVASAGEMQAILQAGFDRRGIRLAGPGKTDALIAAAVDRGVAISAESPEEVERIAELAFTAGRPARVALRLEPREPRKAFAVQMGRPDHPFGMTTAEAADAVRILVRRADLMQPVGVHVYGGTQCISRRAWLAYLAEVLDIAAPVAAGLGGLAEINVGGGFGVAHGGRPELDVEAVGPAARRMMEKFPGRPRFVLELGRFLVADAGVYLTTVLRVRRRAGRPIAVLDGGVHHLWSAGGRLGPRPTAVAVTRPGTRGAPETFGLVGPLCTPLDDLGEVEGVLAPGDAVAFLRVGGYGATLSPVNFLGFGPPQETLLDGAALRDDPPEPG